MKISRKKLNKGGILAVTLILGLSGVSFVLGFYGWSMNKSYSYNRRIAKVKAFYNAETGMARRAYDYLWKVDFIEGYEGIEGETINKNMGFYLKPGFSYNNSGERIAGVYGVHNVRNGSGVTYRCSAFVQLPAQTQTLASYMYLTDSENAGGAPFTFNDINSRREVSFGSSDKLEGIIQSNGQLVVSDYGCPDFSDAELFLTNSTPVDLGQCGSYQQLFGWGNEIDTASKPPVKLPPVGYETLKRVANHVIESDIKINTSSKDTLIMTDILFKEDGGYTVKQWWYLIPPHLKPDANLTSPTADDLDLEDPGQCNTFLCQEFNDDDDLRSTNAYLDFLASYHAKYPGLGFLDRFLIAGNYTRPTTGPHGLHHFDIDQVPETSFGPPPQNLILNQNFPGNGLDKVIYIKGGPVRVKGFYKGRYTVVTDEHTTYRRHAWPNAGAPIDTIWNNIWLTGDLVNADAKGSGDSSDGLQNIGDGNMREFQPSPDCEGGSENSMGLVSGANIYIANTHENGAKNRNNQGNIIINSALLALNESFVMHYFQNSTTAAPTENGDLDPLDIFGNQSSHESPFGDGRGDNVNEFGQTTTGNNDRRGNLYLWGGVVQKYRGYMERNPQSPYGNADIGMDKSYHYDANLDCTPPPFYPAIEFDDGSGEIQIKMIGYNSVL